MAVRWLSLSKPNTAFGRLRQREFAGFRQRNFVRLRQRDNDGEGPTGNPVMLEMGRCLAIRVKEIQLGTAFNIKNGAFHNLRRSFVISIPYGCVDNDQDLLFLYLLSFGFCGLAAADIRPNN